MEQSTSTPLDDDPRRHHEFDAPGQSTSTALDDDLRRHHEFDAPATPCEPADPVGADGLSLLTELARDADGLIIWDSHIRTGAVTNAAMDAARDMAAQTGAGAASARLARIRTDQLRNPADPTFERATLLMRAPWLRLRLDGWGDVSHRRLADGSVVLVKRLDGERTVLPRLRAAGYELDPVSCIVTDEGELDAPLAAATPLVRVPDPVRTDEPPAVPTRLRRRTAPVTAIVPAHNEAATVEAAIASLVGQTVAPERILIVSDNSTDPTPSLVADLEAWGVELIRTVNNVARKSGALNAGLRHLLSAGALGAATGYVLTMDADTELHPQFLELALGLLDRDESLGGLSATCLGRTPADASRWGRTVAWFQRAEYTRYAYTRIRTNIHTMSGAAALYRANALDGLVAERGEVFDERPTNLVEDYETTLALRDAGWRCTTNGHCIAYTQLETTVRGLVRQRQRWVRGTIDELRRRGRPGEHTWASVGQIALGAAALPWVYAWLTYAVVVGVTDGRLAPTWLMFSAAIGLWQAWTIRPMGRSSMLVAALLIPELVYGLVRSYWFFTAIGRSLTRRSQPWS